MEHCRAVNLRLECDKCNFEQFELKYLGQVIGYKLVRPVSAKVKAIDSMPAPETREARSRVLGMATYLGKFCPNLAEVTAPLRDLTKKSIPWVWGEAQQKSMVKLKAMLTSGQTLKIFYPKFPTTLSVDSSKIGMKAVIMQSELNLQVSR